MNSNHEARVPRPGSAASAEPGRRRALLLLLTLTLWLLGSAGVVRGATLARSLPRPGGDHLLVARAAAGKPGTRLERWQVRPWRRVAARTVAGAVTNMVPRGGTLLLQSGRRLWTMPADLSAPPQPVWEAPSGLTILRTVALGKDWLALAASAGGQPRGGRVYRLFPQTGTARLAARRLTLLPRYNFWELQIGDVEGDGRPEIALCTWSKTNRIRTYARRYFVYGWSDARGDVFPRWRGSRLSKPYRQARLVRLGTGPGHQLLSVEETRTGRRCLVAYRWNDFGFTGLAQSAPFDAARIEEAADDGSGGAPLVRVRTGNRERVCMVASPRDDRLPLNPVCALSPRDVVVVGRFQAASGRQALVLPGGSPAAGARLYDLGKRSDP